MTIIFASTQPELCYYIIKQLKEFSCLFISDTKMLFPTIENQKESSDLLVLDYLLFNHDIFNIHNYIKDELHVFLPIIFYNDPCMLLDDKKENWKSMLNILYSYQEDYNYSKYEAFLSKLATVLDSKEIAPYIELKPKRIDTQNFNPLNFLTKDKLISVKKEYKIPSNLFFLLTILFDNRNYTLTLNDIKKIYEDYDKQISIESLKVLLSNLKKYLAMDEKNRFSIIKHEKGFQLLCL